MHLGHASTYLLAWLQVRSHHGQLILRMEDVDRQRCKPEFAEAWRQDLQWLGLFWDEEAPAQSTRDAAYLAALESLQKQGLVFGCQCTRRDMDEAVRAPHQPWGAYPGTCVAANWPLDGSVALRLAYPEDAFVLRRADGAWSYPLAVVVDDRDQGVTHILRGQDLAPSELPQAFLHQALGNVPPACTHAPLWMGPDGARLSKRHGSLSIAALREKGWSAAAIWGWVACALGYVSTTEPCVPSDMISSFLAQPIRSQPVSHEEVLPLWA
jgi:glutamyl-tRNA synthetase